MVKELKEFGCSWLHNYMKKLYKKQNKARIKTQNFKLKFIEVNE